MSQATRISQTTEAIRTPPKSTSHGWRCRTSAACSPIQPIALHFHSVKTTTLPQHPPFGLAAGILGTISALFGLVPVLGTASAVIGAVSGTICVVNTEMLMNPSPAAPDSQFADHAADLASTLGIYISGLRTHLENTHTGIFSNGINIATLLSNRNSVNRALLNLHCNECLPSSERWTERYLSLKMIKYEWWTQNVFITFMPYGQVTQLDSSSNTTFDESQCASNSLAQKPDLVICNTDDYSWADYLGPGMARLTWPNPADSNPTQPNGDGSLEISTPPAGANSSSTPLLKTTGTSSYKFFHPDTIKILPTCLHPRRLQHRHHRPKTPLPSSHNSPPPHTLPAPTNPRKPCRAFRTCYV